MMEPKIGQSPIVLKQTALAGELSRLFEERALLLDRNWDGTRSSLAVDVWLLRDGSRLVFGARIPLSAHCDMGLKRGDYVEGLWQQDVAEFFIASADGRYQEFNLSPTGAWWSMSFSEPRVREESFSPPNGVETLGEIGDSSWQVVLSIPVGDLAVPLEGFGKTFVNLNVIVREDPRIYLSYAKLPGSRADFHQPQSFCSLHFSGS